MRLKKNVEIKKQKGHDEMLIKFFKMDPMIQIDIGNGSNKCL